MVAAALHVVFKLHWGSNRAGLLWTKRLEWLFRAWVAVPHFCVVWHLVDPATKATWLILPAVTAL